MIKTTATLLLFPEKEDFAEKNKIQDFGVFCLFVHFLLCGTWDVLCILVLPESTASHSVPVSLWGTKKQKPENKGRPERASSCVSDTNAYTQECKRGCGQNDCIWHLPSAKGKGG